MLKPVIHFSYIFLIKVIVIMYNLLDSKWSYVHNFIPNIWNTQFKTVVYTHAYMLSMVKHINVLWCIWAATLILVYCTAKFNTWGGQTGHIYTLHLRSYSQKTNGLVYHLSMDTCLWHANIYIVNRKKSSHVLYYF